MAELPFYLHFMKENFLQNQANFYSLDVSQARFKRNSPLITLITMSFGQFATSITTISLDFLELYFLTKKFSHFSFKPVQLQAFHNFCAQIIILIINYFSNAISTRFGRLLAENNKNDAIRFYTDINKIGIFFLIISLPFIQFLIFPYLEFLKCPKDMMDHCYSLALITISSSPFIFLFHISCSFLQSIGRSFLNGILHIIQSIFQVLVLAPLFLFALDIDITFISLQWSISQSIIGLILFIMIIRNKFGFSVNFSSYTLPVLTVTYETLKNSLSSVVAFLCDVTPPTFIMRFLLSKVSDEETVDSLTGIHSIYLKVSLMSSSFNASISSGLLTVGTFAYGSHDIPRLFKYFGYSILMTVLFNLVFSLFMIIEPHLISQIYLDSSTDISLSKKILKIPFYTNVLSSISFICQTLYICIGKPLRSSILSFVQAFFLTFFAYIFSYKYFNGPEKVYYAYNVSDVILFILTVVVTIPTIINLRKEMKKDDTAILTKNVEFVVE